MVAHIRTIAFHGVDALTVDVQVHLAPGQNAFTVVGLPDKSVAESRERVRAARTLADLSARDTFGESDIATAMAWRRLASIAQI